MKKIQVLGVGCPKCNALYKSVKKIIDSNNIDASLEKITDLNVIMGYGVLTLPGMVIDGTVVFSGKVPSPKELLAIIQK